jgi:integrase
MALIINGKERNRPGRWLVDWTDAGGTRRIKTCGTKIEAEAFFAKVVPLSQQKLAASSYAFDVTLSSFAENFMLQFATTAKPRSVEVYKLNLTKHILPALGSMRVNAINRTTITSFIVRQAELAKGSKKLLVAVLRAVLQHAVRHQVIASNPAEGVARELKLSESPKARKERVGSKAYTADQMDTLLNASRLDARHYPLFYMLSRTGMRISEAIGLEWGDIDFEKGELTISRGISKGIVSTPKSGHGRVIEMSADLAAVLRRLLGARKADKLARGWAELPAPVFVNNVGRPLEESKIRVALNRHVKAAKLPPFTIHGFRHSTASIMLSNGAAPQEVQELLGHSSIALTVDVYGNGRERKGGSTRILDQALRGSK